MMNTIKLPLTTGRLADLQADPLAYMRQLCARFGDIVAVQDGDMRVVFVFGQEYNRRVLSDVNTFHSYFFALRGPRRSAQRRLTSGLISMNGQQHKRHRRLLMDPFQKRSFAAYVEPITELVHDMLADWQPGQTRDIHEDMTQFMLRVTSSILFGFDVPEVSYRLGEMIDKWVAMNHRSGLAAVVPDTNSLDHYDELLEFATGLESELREMIRRRRASNVVAHDVLSILLRAHDAEGGLTDDELIGHAVLLFGAAHLTTAHSLTWTLFLLAQHPHFAEQLCGELHDMLGGGTPQLDEFEELPFLNRVIKESMRILPASAYVQRINIAPVELGPFSLSRGTVVFFSQYITHHLASLYPQPEKFNPDRWLDLNPSPYAYLPFGTGTRMCPGGPLATVVMKLALSTILQRFHLRLVPNSEIHSKAISTMLTPTNGMPMTIHSSEVPFQAQPVTGNVCEMVSLQGS